MTTTPGYTAEGHMALDTSLREFLGDDDLLPSILARAAELAENNPYHDFLGLASREPIAELTAQSVERASPAKDGGEQSWHFGPSSNLDHVRIYPDGAIFDDEKTIAMFPVLSDGRTHSMCERICKAHNAMLTAAPQPPQGEGE